MSYRFSIFPTQKSDPELYPFRHGLFFSFFNALTWQVALGTPLVLFAQRLGASTFQVGLASSFVFLLTPIQIVSTALLPRYGFKRVMLSGWIARSVFLVIPVGLAAIAPPEGKPWMVNALVWSVFFFCVCRSIGSASFTPWLYALLVPSARGRFFTNDQYVSGIAGVGTILVCSALFAWWPAYRALIAQYLIALLGSILSYFALRQLPDAEKPTAMSLRTVARDTPLHVLRPSVFRSYLWIAVGFTVITAPIPPFAAYYLRAVPQLSAEKIMLFEVCRFSGVILAAGFMRSRVESFGAKPFLLASLGLYAAVAIYWWLYLHGGATSVTGFYAIYFVIGLGIATWTAANLDYLPKITSNSDRALTVSIHCAVTSCLGGLSPILWGELLKQEGALPGMNLLAFQWFFASAALGMFLLLAFVARLPEVSARRVEPLVIGGAILRQFRAISSLINLVDPVKPKIVKNPSTDDRGAG